MITESEVHEEVMSEGDIVPEEFMEMFGEISAGGTKDVSIKSAAFIFKKVGMEVPEEIIKAIELLNDDPLNPGQAAEKVKKFQALTQSIHPLYVIMDSLYRKKYYELYPNEIKHGHKERLMSELEAKLSDIKAVRNFLRNTFFVVSRAVLAAQSLMKVEQSEKDISY